jgi:hypothetical protein
MNHKIMRKATNKHVAQLIRNVTFVTILVFAVAPEGLQAQSTIPATGGKATGAGGTVSYTVGQIVYTTNTGTTGTVSQGVQQPYEISVITGIEEAKDISLEMTVYPNPSKDNIKLLIKNFEVQDLKYQIYDLNGSMLQDKKVDGNETTISMQGYKPSTYLLKVIQGNKEIKIFKIIKN